MTAQSRLSILKRAVMIGALLAVVGLFGVSAAQAPAAATPNRDLNARLGAAEYVPQAGLGAPAAESWPSEFDGCTSIMVGRVRAYLVEQRRSGLRRVVFCAYDDVAAAAFKNALSGLTRFEA